ncbi:hypothetical protein COOONC_25935 [Cooperia oncophora]
MSHTQNMYKVGDYVYFETPENTPYQIRRIEDLNKVRQHLNSRFFSIQSSEPIYF